MGKEVVAVMVSESIDASGQAARVSDEDSESAADASRRHDAVRRHASAASHTVQMTPLSHGTTVVFHGGAWCRGVVAGVRQICIVPRGCPARLSAAGPRRHCTQTSRMQMTSGENRAHPHDPHTHHHWSPPLH